jgi:hypothetical protein
MCTRGIPSVQMTMTNAVSSPVVLDGSSRSGGSPSCSPCRASILKLDIDYKEAMTSRRAAAGGELAKDVGVIRMRGGYIVGGIDGKEGLTASSTKH